MIHLTEEFFTELTYMTIQKDAAWMEFEEEMEDFSLLSYIDDALIKEATVFLCGYIPQLDMELAIIGASGEGKGYFFCKVREEGNELRTDEFVLSDRKEDFAANMLMYTATTQIMQRENEKAYHNLAQEYAQSKSGCGGCTKCKPM